MEINKKRPLIVTMKVNQDIFSIGSGWRGAAYLCLMVIREHPHEKGALT